MQFSFSYEKSKVIQALRRHFLNRREIRFMLIVVNVFAITSGILFYLKKIRPEPFLLGSCIWLFLMIAIWFLLPYSVYKKASTFKDSFTLFFDGEGLRLENTKGYVNWQWKQFISYFETPEFFHLYFNSKSFFLVPKENMPDNMRHELRSYLSRYVS